MKTVRQILANKGGPSVLWVAPDATVFDALEVMADHDVGALVVLDEGRLVGVFSERDYARKIILVGKASRDTSVREIMVGQVVQVRPETTVEQCMALMTQRRVRHLPVLEHEQVVGVVSIGDVVKEIISEQAFVITQLEQYIHS